jgi:hypothetical protein
MYRWVSDNTVTNSSVPLKQDVTLWMCSSCEGYSLVTDVDLSKLYCSPNIIRMIKSRRMRWAGHVARRGERRGVNRVLVGKPEGKRPLGRPGHVCVDNIKVDLLEVGCGEMDWIDLAQERERWRALVNAVMNIRVPYNAGNFLTSCEQLRTLLLGISN